MATFGMVDPAIFEDLQTKIDEESQVREELRNILQTLEKQGVLWLYNKVALSNALDRTNFAVHPIPSSLHTFILSSVYHTLFRGVLTQVQCTPL